jgi:hypothetical protein
MAKFAAEGLISDHPCHAKLPLSCIITLAVLPVHIEAKGFHPEFCFWLSPLI